METLWAPVNSVFGNCAKLLELCWIRGGSGGELWEMWSLRSGRVLCWGTSPLGGPWWACTNQTQYCCPTARWRQSTSWKVKILSILREVAEITSALTWRLSHPEFWQVPVKALRRNSEIPLLTPTWQLNSWLLWSPPPYILSKITAWAFGRLIPSLLPLIALVADLWPCRSKVIFLYSHILRAQLGTRLTSVQHLPISQGCQTLGCPRVLWPPFLPSASRGTGGGIDDLPGSICLCPVFIYGCH